MSARVIPAGSRAGRRCARTRFRPRPAGGPFRCGARSPRPTRARAAPHEHRHAGPLPPRLDRTRPGRRGSALMTSATQLGTLADEGHDRVGVPVHAVAGVARLHRQRLDHHGQAERLTGGPQLRDVADALPVQLRLPGQGKEVDDDAGGIEAQRPRDGVLDELAPERARRARAYTFATSVRSTSAGLWGRPAPGAAEPRRRELDRVGPGIHECAPPAPDLRSPRGRNARRRSRGQRRRRSSARRRRRVGSGAG